MTPIEAMVLAFEASGGDEPLGFEGRLLACLGHLGWHLVEKPERSRLRAIEFAVIEYLRTDGSAGLYDAGRMISARNTLNLLLGLPPTDDTHPAFIPDDLDAMGVVMERLRNQIVLPVVP
jgi:hypothetical protein